MPNQDKKNKHRVPFYRRPVIIIPCIIAVIVIAVAVVLIVKNLPKAEQDEQIIEEPENVLVYADDTDEEDEVTPEDEKAIIQYEGENPNQLEYLTGLITYADIVDGRLTAMVSIDQYLGTGVCRANLKSGDQIVASVDQVVEADASTSHCGPIEIDLSGISGGKYQLEVTISSDNKTGVLTTNVEF